MGYQNALTIYCMGAIISIKKVLILNLKYLLYGVPLAYKIFCIEMTLFINI